MSLYDKKIILVSNSPRREFILKKYKIPFKKISPLIDEEKLKKNINTKNPYKIANLISFYKAKSVINKFKSGIIIGADTIVVLKGKIIGKPESREHAIKILKKLSGTTHRVITSVSFIDIKTEKTIITYDESLITFKKLSLKEIKDYVYNNDVLDKAGAYAIQENADPFIKKIKGSYYNIVGFPIEKVQFILKKFDKL